MTRGERTTVLLVACLLALFAATLVFGIADYLNRLTWFGSGANEVQWASGVATFAAVAAGVLGYFARICAASPWCLRFGEHPVDGTLKKVCKRHHRLECHEAVHDRHGAAHAASGRLGWGESHKRLL